MLIWFTPDMAWCGPKSCVYPLVSGTRSQDSCLKNLKLVLSCWCIGCILTREIWGFGVPWAYACLLIFGVRAQWILWLMPAQWYVKLGPGTSACLTVARARFGVSGCRDLGSWSYVGLLMVGPTSWHSWLQDPQCNTACVDSLVGGTRFWVSRLRCPS